MATNPMKIRAANKDGVTEVKVLISHEMETGQRKDASGATIPAWFITDLTAKHNDKVVLTSEFGTSISKNPFLAFRFKGGAKGDKVSVSWKDNKGETRSDEAAIAECGLSSNHKKSAGNIVSVLPAECNPMEET